MLHVIEQTVKVLAHEQSTRNINIFINFL